MNSAKVALIYSMLGFHAEVQAANDIFNQPSNKNIDLTSFDIYNIKVSTKLPNKTPFVAYTNCQLELEGLDILTGQQR